MFTTVREGGLSSHGGGGGVWCCAPVEASVGFGVVVRETYVFLSLLIKMFQFRNSVVSGHNGLFCSCSIAGKHLLF